MKKFFMFVVAAAALVSCGGSEGPIADVTNIYKDATEKVMNAEDAIEIAAIEAELNLEIAQYYAENAEECKKEKVAWDAYAKDPKNVPANIEQYNALKAAIANYNRAVSCKSAELANKDAEADAVKAGVVAFNAQVKAFVKDFNSKNDSKGSGADVQAGM